MEELISLLDLHEIAVGIIVAVVPGIIKAYISQRKAKQEELEKQQIEKQRQEQEMTEKVSELITNYITLQRHVDENTEVLNDLSTKINHLSTGGIAMLCDRVLTSCHDALLQGETSIISRQNITIMYKLYNKYVSQNHINPNVDRLYTEYLKLPVYDSEHFNSVEHEEGSQYLQDLAPEFKDTNIQDEKNDIFNEKYMSLNLAISRKK